VTPSNRENLGILLGVAAACGFSSTVPMTRLAVGWLDPLFLTAARASIAGFVALAVLVFLRRKLPPRDTWGIFVLTGFCVLVGYPVLLALGLRTVPASHGGVVLGILPLAVAALAALLGYERPSVGFWLASAAGAAIVIGFMLRHGAGGIGVGDLMLLGVVIAGATAYTLSGRLSGRMPGWEVITWQLALYLPVSLISALLLWPRDTSAVPLQGWGALLWISFVGQYFSFIASNFGMVMAGVARIGQLMLLQPFIVLLFAIPVNGERFDWETLLFAAAVVGAVMIGQRMRVARR
jgi:drug/metabolite transporter (DMT)-like permease